MKYVTTSLLMGHIHFRVPSFLKIVYGLLLLYYLVKAINCQDVMNI